MTQLVRKIEVPVRVSRAGEAPFDGRLFLSPDAPGHAGPQTILERLNTLDRVIPLARAGDGDILLLSGESLQWVAPGEDVDPALLCPPTWFVTREERVRLRFIDGVEVEGLLRIELPAEHTRASDFLNGPEDFFPLVTSGGILLVNKRRVLEVLVYESSPAPVAAADSSRNG
jgi:hypothetical protein